MARSFYFLMKAVLITALTVLAFTRGCQLLPVATSATSWDLPSKPQVSLDA
jgi:hypothetical protein